MVVNTPNRFSRTYLEAAATPTAVPWISVNADKTGIMPFIVIPAGVSFDILSYTFHPVFFAVIQRPSVNSSFRIETSDFSSTQLLVLSKSTFKRIGGSASRSSLQIIHLLRQTVLTKSRGGVERCSLCWDVQADHS